MKQRQVVLFEDQFHTGLLKTCSDTVRPRDSREISLTDRG